MSAELLNKYYGSQPAELLLAQHDQNLTILERLASLKENWDSYGGAPITPEALKTAALMLTAPSICPCSTGGIVLEWHRDGMDIEVEIGPDGLIVEEVFSQHVEDIAIAGRN